MARLSQEKINEIRQSVDIVDVIGEYLSLQKREETMWHYALFMTIKILLCQFHQINRFLCVLFVEQGVMFLPSYRNI